MGRLSIGIDVTRALFWFILLVVLLWVAMWAVAIGLAIGGALYFVSTRTRAEAIRSSGEGDEPPRVAGAVVALAELSALAGVLMLREFPPVIAIGSATAALVLAVPVYARRGRVMAPPWVTTMNHIAVVYALVMIGMAAYAQANPPEPRPVRFEQVQPSGVASSIDEVASAIGCREGTLEDLVLASDDYKFDDADAASRCEIGGGAYLVSFRNAESLERAVEGSGISFLPKVARDVALTIDGNVAVFALDEATATRLREAGRMMFTPKS